MLVLGMLSITLLCDDVVGMCARLRCHQPRGCLSILPSIVLQHREPFASSIVFITSIARMLISPFAWLRVT